MIYRFVTKASVEERITQVNMEQGLLQRSSELAVKNSVNFISGAKTDEFEQVLKMY